MHLHFCMSLKNKTQQKEKKKYHTNKNLTNMDKGETSVGKTLSHKCEGEHFESPEITQSQKW